MKFLDWALCRLPDPHWTCPKCGNKVDVGSLCCGFSQNGKKNGKGETLRRPEVTTRTYYEPG